MKKLLTILIIFILTMSFTSCGKTAKEKFDDYVKEESSLETGTWDFETSFTDFIIEGLPDDQGYDQIKSAVESFKVSGTVKAFDKLFELTSDVELTFNTAKITIPIELIVHDKYVYISGDTLVKIIGTVNMFSPVTGFDTEQLEGKWVSYDTSEYLNDDTVSDEKADSLLKKITSYINDKKITEKDGTLTLSLDKDDFINILEIVYAEIGDVSGSDEEQIIDNFKKYITSLNCDYKVTPKEKETSLDIELSAKTEKTESIEAMEGSIGLSFTSKRTSETAKIEAPEASDIVPFDEVEGLEGIL